jgi:hypothetical protein
MSVMNTTRKRKPSAPISRDARHLDDLLDQALADSFPASDPVAIDFALPAVEATSEKREE